MDVTRAAGILGYSFNKALAKEILAVGNKVIND